MKKCYKCNVEKPLSEFNKDKHYKDNLHHRCRECTYEYNRKNYLTNNQKKKVRILQKSEGYGVYMIIHKPTQCYYIGEGWLYDRKITHFSKLRRGKSDYGSLQRFFNKHPNIENFQFEVIRKWGNQNKVEGKKIEDKIIKWGFENVPNKILNKNVGIRK